MTYKMKKYRRGSKIVEIVKHRLKYQDKTDANVKQFPVASSEITSTSHDSAIDEAVLSFQQSKLNQQDVKVQDKPFGAQRIFASNTIVFRSSSSIVPTTSRHSARPSYRIVQDKIFGHSPNPVSSRTLLNNDLYLTDSSDEYFPGSDETTTSSSDFSDDTTQYRINRKYTKTCFEGIPISSNKEFSDRNREADTTNICRVESATSGQQNRKRRQAAPSQWKKNIRKNKRHYGEPYVSAKGILIPGKTLKESKCMGKCMHQCTSKVSEEERLEIFSSFWKINNMEEKRLYVVSLIEREKAKCSKRKQSRKKLSNKYFLKKIGKAEKLRVCQKFFLATLNVSETFVRICFKKVIDNNIVVPDKRGKHAPHNKKSKEIRELVRSHIKSFPRMPPPRIRKDTKKEYLGSNLNLTKMYKLYKIKCDSEQRESVELAFYRSVFNKDFNIGFHRPGRDVCDICLTYEQLIEEGKENEIRNHDLHLKRIISARKHRHEAKRLAQFGKIHFAEYDLKAICDCPSSSPKLKRTFPLYNFTVVGFNKDDSNIHCFYWDECIARRGAAEIGSCLYKYLQSIDDGKPITFMSDTCASQCRNMYISSLLLYCVEMLDIPEINQKYFEQGHSQMETDNIHAHIEKAKKNILIHNPSDFYTIIKKSLQEYPNKVYEMTKEDFIDLKYLKNVLVKNAKVDYHGEPVIWLNIRWLQYRKENTNYIYFKYDLDEKEFNKIEVIRRGKRLQNCKDIVLLKKVYYA